MKQLTSTLIVTGLSWVFFSCQSEKLSPDTSYAKGRILFSMPTAEPFIEDGTRATQKLTDLTGYTFTLSGTDTEGHPINGIIKFEDNSCIIPAGTYTLTADNQEAAVPGLGAPLGAPYYHGTSASFSLKAGSTMTVPTIEMGKPKNTRIDLTLEESFTELYDLQSLTLSDGSRTISLNANNRQGFMMVPKNTRIDLTLEDTFTKLYDLQSLTLSDGSDGSRTISLDDKNLQGFMMVPENNTLTYTIKATAKSGSHVTDLPAEGLTKTLTVTAGYAYPIHLTAQAIEDMMIGIGEGSYEGVFDAPAEKFPENLE